MPDPAGPGSMRREGGPVLVGPERADPLGRGRGAPVSTPCMVADGAGRSPGACVPHWAIEPGGRSRGGRPARTGSPRWWFTSRATGRIVLAQVPNLALVVFLLAAAAGRLIDGHHQAAGVLSDVASGAIVFWSLDEIVRGVNPWRRVLGIVVLTASVVSIARR